MTKEQRAKMRADKEAEKLAGTPCAECAGVLPAHAETCSKYVKPPVNLDDPAQQEAILNPKPLELTIGGEPAKHYPLPANEQCALIFSFMQSLTERARIYGAVVGMKGGRVVSYDELGAGEQFAELCRRYARALSSDKPLKAEFSRLLARAEQPPDADLEDDDEKLAIRAKLINRSLAPGELLTAIGKLLIENEVFGGPKTRAAAAKT